MEEIRTYLVGYCWGDLDGYEYRLFEAIDDESLLIKAKEYAKYGYAVVGEHMLYVISFTLVTDPGVKRMFNLVDDEWMNGLKEDAHEDLLAKYQKELPNGISIWATGDPKRL
jgi:hypothetical protein